MTAEIGDAKVLTFLENRFKAGDLAPTEAWHTFLMALEHLKADLELVEMAKVSHLKRWKTVGVL